jgi:hypothetical protein
MGNLSLGVCKVSHFLVIIVTALPTQRRFLSGIWDGGNKRLAPRVSAFVAKSGEKGFEPLTFGFGDHCSTIGTILLQKKWFLVHGICTYFCLFSNQFATLFDLNWCFFSIRFFFQFGLPREIVSLRMWF